MRDKFLKFYDGTLFSRGSGVSWFGTEKDLSLLLWPWLVGVSRPFFALTFLLLFLMTYCRVELFSLRSCTDWSGEAED